MKALPWYGNRQAQSLFEDYNQFFDSFNGFGTYEGNNVPIDVVEDDNAYNVTAEFPGVEKRDIKVTLQNGNVTISAEQKEEKREAKENYRVRERRYGSFSRTLALSDKIDLDKVTSEYKEGVLSINLPKAEEVKPKQIEIK